jgi:hypothetical protein
MTAIRISAWLGIVLSTIGVFLKIRRVMLQAEWWPFFAYDYIAAAMILVGAYLVLRRGGAGRLLAGGWGFGVAMCYGSFFGHLENFLNHQGKDLGFEKTMSIAVGVLLAINTLGLVLALWPDKRSAAEALAAQSQAKAA